MPRNWAAITVCGICLVLIVLQIGDIASIQAIAGRRRQLDSLQQFLAAESDAAQPCLAANGCRQLLQKQPQLLEQLPIQPGVAQQDEQTDGQTVHVGQGLQFRLLRPDGSLAEALGELRENGYVEGLGEGLGEFIVTQEQHRDSSTQQHDSTGSTQQQLQRHAAERPKAEPHRRQLLQQGLANLAALGSEGALEGAHEGAVEGGKKRGRRIPGFPWMKKVKRVNGWPVYVPEETEEVKHEPKNIVFNAGGHSTYPHCDVEPLQIIQIGLTKEEIKQDVPGLNVKSIRRPLGWEDLESVIGGIEGKHTVIVEAAGLPCGWQKCCKGTVAFRSGSTDLHVFEQIFVRHFLKDLVMAAPRDSAYILDAGGNGGYSTLLFAGLWPKAQVIVVEPDESNLRILEVNIAGRPFSHNVHVIRGGLWGYDTTLTADPEAKGKHGEWGNVVRETEEGQGFPAYSVESLMKKYNFPRLDIAKIDIEGAESVVFGVHNDRVKVQDWLPQVNMLTLEVHPWFAWHYFKQDKLFEKLTTVIASPAFNGGLPFMLGFDNEHYIFKRVQFLGHGDDAQPAKWAPVQP